VSLWQTSSVCPLMWNTSNACYMGVSATLILFSACESACESLWTYVVHSIENHHRNPFEYIILSVDSFYLLNIVLTVQDAVMSLIFNFIFNCAFIQPDKRSTSHVQWRHGPKSQEVSRNKAIHHGNISINVIQPTTTSCETTILTIYNSETVAGIRDDRFLIMCCEGG